MVKCVVCNKPAAPGSRFCSRCLGFIEYEDRNMRRRAGLRVWNPSIDDSIVPAAPEGSSSRLEPYNRLRPVKKGGMIVWATMITSLELETKDDEFTAVVERLADKELTAD